LWENLRFSLSKSEKSPKNGTLIFSFVQNCQKIIAKFGDIATMKKSRFMLLCNK
jgi:hypothetical protein